MNVAEAKALHLASANAAYAARLGGGAQTTDAADAAKPAATAAALALADALADARATMADLKGAARAAAGTPAHRAAHAATEVQASVIAALKGVAATTAADRQWAAAKSRIDA